MRMRKRPNLEPRMEKCAELLVDKADIYKGKWKTSFFNAERLYLELGCGKGRFTVETAKANSTSLMVAVEKVRDAMVIAMERAKAEKLDNIRFIDADAAKLADMFSAGEVDRIFINFCDPWPKSRDAKFRLTAPGFLRSYCDLLPIGGQIHFKTDNLPLFCWSIEQFQNEGWVLSNVTNDLHGSAIEASAMTDYEAKFVQEGLKINSLVAQRDVHTFGLAAGEVPRLRNAALADARAFDSNRSADHMEDMQ